MKISACNAVTQFFKQFPPPYARHIIIRERVQVVLQEGLGALRRLLNSIPGLLYLLTISSICYQQRQKNRKRRRPTAGEIKGKLGWNFYITLDGGALPEPPPTRSSSLFDFLSPASWSTDLTLAVSASSIIEFHPRINIKQSSANVDGIFAHFLSRKSCKLEQTMNRNANSMMWSPTDRFDWKEKIGDLLQIVYQTIASCSKLLFYVSASSKFLFRSVKLSSE